MKLTFKEYLEADLEIKALCEGELLEIGRAHV